MSFEQHWEEFSKNLNLTRTDRSIAALFYDWGRFDVGQTVAEALKGSVKPATIQPPKSPLTEDIKDERTSSTSDWNSFKKGA